MIKKWSVMQAVEIKLEAYPLELANLYCISTIQYEAVRY
jgi:hypothetical protein